MDYATTMRHYNLGCEDARRAMRCMPTHKAVEFASAYFPPEHYTSGLTPENAEYMRGMTDTLLVLIQHGV